MMQSAAMAGVILLTAQATITLQLKLGLPMAISSSPKSLGVANNTSKGGKEEDMKQHLQRDPGEVCVSCDLARDMLKYIKTKLHRYSYKMMQSAAVAGVILLTAQATITLQLNDH